MLPFEMPSATILGISALNQYLREALESDPVLQDLWVRGEISNFSAPKSGHLYFSLKDTEAQMRCVMWKTSAFQLRFQPQDGQMVEAHGSMNIYPAGGQLQFYVSEMRPAGVGALFAEFMRLKNKLEGEGLFDEAHKRPIPAYPKHIGVVSSASGAALQDILNTLGRRRPDLKVSIAPSTVQGIEAPKELLLALESLNKIADLDLIIIARGGGSMEDLWAFNDEALARAVYRSRCPVISGVGHETDFTILDFVADLRAPTPTAAAERASAMTRADLLLTLTGLSEQMRVQLSLKLQNSFQALQLAKTELKRFAPGYRIANALQQLDDLRAWLERASRSSIQKAKQKLEQAQSQLEALNPQAVLSRGYAILSDLNSGQIISSIHQSHPGQEAIIQLKNGSLTAQIQSIQPGDLHARKK
ncbi:MAG: exodeoxyribonuclease VII large subunit [Anaerolineaceae bacterium]|nr:exodeoxyribonuclease VII large subunit [Anaerolineaceae bacterium]